MDGKKKTAGKQVIFVHPPYDHGEAQVRAR